MWVVRVLSSPKRLRVCTSFIWTDACFVMQFTMESFLSVFEQFIASYRTLLGQGALENGSASNMELSYLVANRVSLPKPDSQSIG